MKFKLDQSVPSDLKFSVQHLTIEFDTPEEFDQAQIYIDGWKEQQVAKIPPAVLAQLKDHAPKKFGGSGGGGKKPDAAPPQPGEYNNLVERAAAATGQPAGQPFHSMIWGFVGSYADKQGVEKGPFHRGYDADVADAKTKGWDWKAGNHVEKLTAVVRALESGDAVPIRYAKGSFKNPAGGWDTTWENVVLTPVPQGSPAMAAPLVVAPPLNPFETPPPPGMPEVPPFPTVGDFTGDDPPPPTGFGEGTHNVPF